MNLSSYFGILLVIISGFVPSLHAQSEAHDLRAKRESDRAKDERVRDDRSASDMKGAARKADPSFWATQGLHAKSARDLKRAQDSKSASEMSADLRAKTDKNSVPFTTPTTKGHIDLAGKPHFDKATNRFIPTPHVHTQEKSVGPGGKVNYRKETIRPATKQDIRTAQKIADKKR